jgi:hypothetical protein
VNNTLKGIRYLQLKKLLKNYERVSKPSANNFPKFEDIYFTAKFAYASYRTGICFSVAGLTDVERNLFLLSVVSKHWNSNLNNIGGTC